MNVLSFDWLLVFGQQKCCCALDIITLYNHLINQRAFNLRVFIKL